MGNNLSKFMNKVGLALITAMIVAAVVGAILMLQPEPQSDHDWAGANGANGAAKTPTATTPQEETPLPDAPPLPSPQPTAAPKSTASESQLAEWQDKISSALADDSISNQVAVQRLLSLAKDPKVDEDVRLDALEHSLNLTEDEEFGEVLPLLTDKSVPVDMLDSALTDLYNRGDRVKLESVLEVAKVPEHPLHEDAIELLEFYVDENYGDDWDAWGTAVNTYFTENEIE